MLSVDLCNGESEHLLPFLKNDPKLVIAQPAVFEKYESYFSDLKERYQLLTIGLVYTYHHPDELSSFNALIYVNDSSDRIRTTVAELLKANSLPNNTSPSDALTKREKEILKLLVNGYTTKKIADSLFISTHTVNAHRKNIMRKLDIKTVSGLTIYAVLNNIITLKEV